MVNFKFDELKKLLEKKNMVGRIYHVGLTVSDLDRSIAFYRDILGLEFQGEIFMEATRQIKCSVRKIVKQGLHI